jgi:hypothetical protein
MALLSLMILSNVSHILLAIPFCTYSIAYIWDESKRQSINRVLYSLIRCILMIISALIIISGCLLPFNKLPTSIFIVAMKFSDIIKAEFHISNPSLWRLLHQVYKNADIAITHETAYGIWIALAILLLISFLIKSDKRTFLTHFISFCLIMNMLGFMSGYLTISYAQYCIILLPSLHKNFVPYFCLLSSWTVSFINTSHHQASICLYPAIAIFALSEIFVIYYPEQDESK